MKNTIIACLFALMLTSCAENNILGAFSTDDTYNPAEDFCEAIVTPDMSIKGLKVGDDPASGMVKHITGKAVLDGAVEYDFWFIIDEGGEVYLMTLTDGENGTKLIDGMYKVQDKETENLVKEMYLVG